MFYLIYPALDLFDRQLDRALKLSKEKPLGNMQEEIRRSICDFLDSTNSVIYHTIHTDQMFLMIPGYTGTSFSIPIKLCLLYLWFIDKVIYLLNDSPDSLKYQCLLTPERESKATTMLIDMGLPHGDRLICVKLSQRSLYMPRDLLSILAHEIAHYVGNAIRHRKERTHYIVCTVSIIIANSIIYGSGLSHEEETFIRELAPFEKRLQNYFYSQLVNRLKSSDAVPEYHNDKVKKHIATGLDFIMTDYDGSITKIFNELPEQVFHDKIMSQSEPQNFLKMIYDLQTKFEKNRLLILSTGATRKLIHELSLLYKEIFSDVAAHMILKFDPNIFQEAFRISEGYRLEQSSSNPQQLMRQAVIEYLLKPEEREKIFFSYFEMPEQQSQIENYTIYNRVAEDFYYFDATKRFIIDYVNICKASLEERLRTSEVHESLTEVTNLFQKFCQQAGTVNQQGDDPLYKTIQDKIEAYSEKIDLKLSEYKSSN